jgi:hypothetical protein
VEFDINNLPEFESLSAEELIQLGEYLLGLGVEKGLEEAELLEVSRSLTSLAQSCAAERAALAQLEASEANLMQSAQTLAEEERKLGFRPA